MVAGRMKTSARNATTIVSASRPPNQAVGLYSDSISTAKPQLLMIAVVSAARPSCVVAVSIASSVVAPAASLAPVAADEMNRVVVHDAERDAGHHDGRDVQRDAEPAHHAEDGEHRKQVRHDRQQAEPPRAEDEEDHAEHGDERGREAARSATRPGSDRAC